MIVRSWVDTQSSTSLLYNADGGCAVAVPTLQREIGLAGEVRRELVGCGVTEKSRETLVRLRDFCLLAVLGLLASCSFPGARHEILGAGGYGYTVDAVEVVADVQVDALRIRHVRLATADCAIGHLEHLELDGPIGPDATDQVDRMLSSAAHCQTPDGRSRARAVYLNSRGGSLFHGLLLADVLRFHEVETIVLGNQLCASACAVAFLGGLHRTIVGDGRLLFHAPFVVAEDGIDCASPDQAHEFREHFVSLLGAAAGQQVSELALRHCSETGGWIVGGRTARRFGITTR
jgi:ATP-dependent protease ClpP protease subunit